MTDATATLSKTERKRGLLADLVFLIQVSRPGLWTTTALFYLMPLGHWNIFGSAAFWTGDCFTCSFHWVFLLYGVNDIVDAEADRFESAQGDVFVRAARSFRSACDRCAGKSPWCKFHLWSCSFYPCGASHGVVARDAAACRRALQRAASGMEKSPAFRRTDSSELFASIHLKQLAESERRTAPLADVGCSARCSRCTRTCSAR